MWVFRGRESPVPGAASAKALGLQNSEKAPVHRAERAREEVRAGMGGWDRLGCAGLRGGVCAEWNGSHGEFRAEEGHHPTRLIPGALRLLWVDRTD